MPSGKGISIVSTVRNEESHIREFLDSVSGLSEPYELIVVDAESTDRTGEIISSYRGIPDLKYIRKKCSRGEGRNIGASGANTITFYFWMVTVSFQMDSWIPTEIYCQVILI